MKKTDTQNRQILEYMVRGKRITALGALQLFKSFRLSARIYDLRQMGVVIERGITTDGIAHFAEYWIEHEHKAKAREILDSLSNLSKT